MKFAAFIAAALTLSACVGGGSSVSRGIVDNGLSCPSSPNMVTMGNLPVRCGPQTVLPYTLG